MKREELEAEQSAMRQRHPRKLKPRERRRADRDKRRKIAKCLLGAGVPPHDIIDLPRLFRRATMQDLQRWIDRGCPLT